MYDEDPYSIRLKSIPPSTYTLPDVEKSIDDPERLSQASSRVTRMTSVADNFGAPFDPNFDETATYDEDATYDESPYPEVRSAVANFDDITMPVNTVRAWTLGIFWAILLPGLNQFFFFRYPTISVSGLVVQLLAFPMGRAWDRLVPRVKILGLSLNQGPFSIKEHVLITVIAGVAAGTAYAAEILTVQRVYYKQNWGFIYQWMMFMSTQMIGFSAGGISRRLLVIPPSMIWPNTLVTCALFNTLHSQQYIGAGADRGISRERFFAYIFIVCCIWFFIPGYLFQALGIFNWVCWIAPNNIVVNQLFGYHSGLGMSLLSFDWNEIAFVGSPLVTPWWSEANVFAGFVIFYWIVTPIVYYSDIWYSTRLPILSGIPYDNTGRVYNVTQILKADATFDIEGYRNYSPLFLSTSFAISYGLSFACISATIVHSVLYFWKPIRIHLRRSLREQPDVHSKLMANYPQVPEWWYAIILAVTFVFACVCVQIWPTHLPIWALLVALVVAMVYMIPIGMLLAITNRQIGLNVVSELIVGYMLPGKPIAMMIFKTFAYVSVVQAMVFTADIKLGHYMKIPPKVMFAAQIVGTIIAGTVQVAVQTWVFGNIPGVCDSNQKQNFTCGNTHVFGSASIIWGMIGPALQFSDGIYYNLLYFFLVGAICPVILWILAKRYPSSWITYINFPIVFGGVGLLPPATAVNYVPWAIMGFFFQYLMRRRHFPFWAKYNYVLSAALDAGTAVGTILVYFCLQYPLNGKIGINTIQTWWGNTVYQHTTDWTGQPLHKVDIGAKFGPSTW